MVMNMNAKQMLLGQPYLKQNTTYGEEECFHFGELVEYVMPRFGKKTKGSVILCTRASLWNISGTITTGDCVIDVIAERELKINFPHGVLTVTPDPEAEDLDDWVLFNSQISIQSSVQGQKVVSHEK